MSESRIEAAYRGAKALYAESGIDTEAAIKAADSVPISIHCWQGDDLGGFERAGAKLSGGGIQAVGNYPGKARTLRELRADIEEALLLVPGAKRLSLHASYGDFGGNYVDRDAIDESHFASWIAWAAELGLSLDFNATLFSHSLAEEGYTLAHRDAAVRAFWIEHARRTRRIAGAMGRAQGDAALNNIWIPDGSKDIPVDRVGFRERLIESLDLVFSDSLPPEEVEDAVEGKLFGIGSEAFVVGSHDFYLGYAATRNKFLTIDMGHFHPTENVADKISAVMPFIPGILLHLSRGLRWDSDHVVILDDQLSELAKELARSKALDRIRVGLDYFDASINRIGAWAIGARSTRKALLAAMLEPHAALLDADARSDGFARLALLEAEKTLPWNAVWDEYCRRFEVPDDRALIASVEDYERRVLSKRR